MNTKELKQFILKVKKFNKGNNTLPILDSILIKDQRLIVSNLEVTFKKYFADLNPELNVLIDLKFLEQIAKKTKMDKIDLNTAGIIKIGKNEFTYNGLDDIKDYPEYDLPKFKNAGYLDDNTIKDLKIAVNFVANDDLRPVMGGVNITKDMIYSTDAHLCYFINHVSAIENKWDNIIIPKDVINLLTDSSYTILECDDNKRYSFTSNTEEIIFYAIDGKYPNVDAVIPKENDKQIFAPKIDLLESISLAEIAANKGTSKISLKISQGYKVSTTSNDPDYNRSYSGEIVNSTTNYSDDFEIGFNSKFLAKIFKFVDNNEVRIDMSQANRAAIINDHFLIMPVMLK